MRTWLFTIETAVRLFPYVALLMTLPFVIYQFRKYGSIPWPRFACLYLFAFYLTTAYLLVILPLPPRESVANLNTSYANLRLFSNLGDLASITDLQNITTDSGTRAYLVTLARALAHWPGLEAVFNIVFFVPFGVFLHYYFRRGLLRTGVESFLLSLFFELTQLTGLYGYYPRPYRLFDVNDLFNNTLGGVIGWLVTGLLTWFLPTREEIDARAYENADVVSYTKRASALLIDRIVVSIVILPLSELLFALLARAGILTGELSSYGITLLLVVLLFTLVPWLTGGYTLGKYLLHLRLADYRPRVVRTVRGRTVITPEQVRRPGLAGLFLRALILHGFLLGIALSPEAFLPLIGLDDSPLAVPDFLLFSSGGWSLWLTLGALLVLAADMIVAKLRGTRVLLYERLTGIQNRAV